MRRFCQPLHYPLLLQSWPSPQYYDPARGPVKSPLLLWALISGGWPDRAPERRPHLGAYDFSGDGTHPSASGRQKVADMLLSFFKTDANAKTWFAKPPEK